MKKTVIAVVLIIVILGLMPFISGLLMERTVRRVFQDINSIYDETGTGYSLEIIDYDRGYLTSNIEWKIDLGALKDIYHIEEITFVDHAKHGFTRVVSTTSLEKNPWFATFVAEKLQGINPLHISTAYSLLGSIKSTIAWDAFSVAVEGEKVDVKPASLVLKTDYRLKDFSSSGNWQGLSVGEKLVIGDTSLASDLEKISTFIWDGDVSFEVQEVKAQEKEVLVELKGLKGKYLFNVNDDQTSLSAEALLSINGLVVKGVKVNNSSVRLAVSGVNVEDYEEFIQMYTRAMPRFTGRMESIEKDSEKAKELMYQLMAAYERILKKGLEIQMSDLQIKLPEGNIKGDITLRLLKDMIFMQFARIVNQPDLFTDIFYIKSHLSLPVNLLGEESLLNSLLLAPLYPGMQTGLFVKNGDYLVHKAETIDKKLMVNDKEVPLAR